MGKKKLRHLIACLICIIITFGSVIDVVAADFYTHGNNMIVNGKYYWENDTGGAKAYVPFQINKQGENINTLSELLKLPEMVTSYGTLARNAAFRYHGFDGILGSNSQYLVKNAAMKSVANQGTVWLPPPYYLYNSNYLLSFRYAGMVVTGYNDYEGRSGLSTAGTNPQFPSDNIWSTPSADRPPIDAEVYKAQVKNGGLTWEGEHQTVYGSTGGVHQLADMYTNGLEGSEYWLGAGTVPSNKHSGMNDQPEVAKRAFERWIAEDSGGYGAAYKEQAESWIQANGSSLSWWEVLNRYFKILGDPMNKDASVYYYMVGGKLGGTVFYNTYTLEGKIEKNVTPTLFAIWDKETQTLLSESYRNHTEMDMANGGGLEHQGPVAELVRGKSYDVAGILSFYSNKEEDSKTKRCAQLMAVGKGVTSDAYEVPIALSPLSFMPYEASLNHMGPIDRKNSGTVRAAGNRTSSSGSDSYYYQGMAFDNQFFVVNDSMPQSGYLYITVPDAWSENGDNDVLNDDRLAIPYRIQETPPPPDHTEDVAYGDLNLGMPEYRSLHFIREEEKEKEEGDSGENSGPGGEASGSGESTDGAPEAPEKVTYEYYSDYGYYKNADAGLASERTENDEAKVPDDNKIWDAGNLGADGQIGDAWWDYTRHVWPDQVEDLENKCWLLDSDGGWNESGQFLRSKGTENSFGFGFRVSRSRGRKDSILRNAVLKTQIYGVSPDTGEDGVLLEEYTDSGSDYKTLRTDALGVYEYQDTKYQGIVSSKTSNGIEDFPRIRVVTAIDKDTHGESGFHNNYFTEPGQNSWETEHDTVDRTFACEMDDMRIMEIEIKDSEGIVIFHADRYDSEQMETVVDAYYDREEDLFMKVVIEQNLESGHTVKDPAIDVLITGQNEAGASISTYVDTTFTLEGTELGEGVRATYDNIVFHPKQAPRLRVNVEINEKHGADMWRENIWNNEDDACTYEILSTTADLGLSQDITVHNSKNNPQSFLNFGEELGFRFDVKHLGRTTRQMQVVGGSDGNPNAMVDVKIYNGDQLTRNPVHGNLVYRMIDQDPKASAAFLKEDRIQANARLFPGLGTNGFSTHIQAWMKNYIVQTYRTATGNVAAYGRLLVTGNIDSYHDSNQTNIRDNTTDYVQKEFYGEKNFKVVDMAVTARNSISGDTGIAVQMAIQNMPSSYNDQTIVDKTYADVYVDGELKKTIEVEVRVGDTVVTEAVIDRIDLNQCKVVEVRVNTGKHQTHYEYVLETTDRSLYPDPFVDNYMSLIVCANKPNETVCPLCVLDDDIQIDSIFDGAGGGATPTPPSNVTDTSKYTVIFAANNGTATENRQQIAYESTANLKENAFTYTGYTFTGWNTSPDGSGRAYANKAVISVGTRQSYGAATQLTLYAQWKPITYTIKFNANGGTGTMAPVSATFGTAQYLPANTFERIGYAFGGWNTAADGSGISIGNGGSVMNFADTQGAAITLYAQWLGDADCIILENFVADPGVSLSPGDRIVENPSLLSLVDYSAYGYMMVKIPTVQAAVEGDPLEKVRDVFRPDWDVAHWTKVYEKKGSTAGEESVYVWRYADVLAPNGTTLSNSYTSDRKANQTTDLYSRLTVDQFLSLSEFHVSTELLGLVYATAGETPTPEELAITDRIALSLLGIEN